MQPYATRIEVGDQMELDVQKDELLAAASHDLRTPLAAIKSAAQLLMRQLTRTGGVDPTRRFERALSNLVGNSVKYRPFGGEVTVSLWRTLQAGGAWAVIEVRDQGVGIPSEDLPRLFEWTFRGANVVGRMPGTGLGLATVR